MNKVYYSQRDNRWANIIYSAKPPHTETIKSAGCGITSAAMIISSLTDKTVLPPEMAEYSVKNGYRIDGVGTSWALFTDIAQKYNLKCVQSYNIDDAIQCVKNGGLVVCSTSGGKNGLFSTGGHLFCMVGISNYELEFYDPDLYAGKYTLYGRDKKARVKGNSVFVTRTNAKPEIVTYFCFSKREEKPLANFEDVKGNFAEDDIFDLVQFGIVHGLEDGLFHPNEPITRAQAAVMIRNTIRYIIGK